METQEFFKTNFPLLDPEDTALERFEEAEKNPEIASLLLRLKQLNNIAINFNSKEFVEKVHDGEVAWEDAPVKCGLYTDASPLCFYFEVRNSETMTLHYNGGIIYHGAHDGFGSGAGPTYAVTLTPAKGWRIHT